MQFGTPDPRRIRPGQTPKNREVVTNRGEGFEVQRRLFIDGRFTTLGARVKNPNRNTHKTRKSR